MKFPTLLLIFLAYLAVVGQAVQIFLTIRPNFPQENQVLSILIIILLIGVPLLIYFLSIRFYFIAKFFRIKLFNLIDAKSFSFIGVVIIVIFSIRFLFNLLVKNAYHADQIFLNVFFLNIMVLMILILIASGQFKINKSSALLLRIRGKTDIFVYEDKSIRYIPDPQTLYIMGYNDKDVQEISEDEFNSYRQQPPVQSIFSCRLIRVDGKPAVYFINGENKHLVPDPPTRNYILLLTKKQNEEIVTQQEADRYSTKKELKSILA